MGKKRRRKEVNPIQSSTEAVQLNGVAVDRTVQLSPAVSYG